MAVLALRGRSYIYPGGLSESSGDWYVVGLVTIPVRVDSMLGWRNPPDSRNSRVTEKDRPQFTPTQAYLVIPAENDGSSWQPVSTDCSFVPLSGVEEIYESGDIGRVPVSFRAPYYTTDYSIGEDQLDFELREIVLYPARVDSTLGWRTPLTAEEPSFVSVDVATCISGSEIYRAPMFLASKVYSWQFIPGATSSSGEGTQGPAGSSGAQGARGFQGLVGSGSQGFQGTDGFQGPAGADGEAGIFTSTELINEINFIDFSYDYYGINFIGSTCTVYLPVASSPFDDGKTIIIEDETGSANINIIAQGGQTIEGQPNLEINTAYGTAYLVVRNGAWFNLSTSGVLGYWGSFWSGATQTSTGSTAANAMTLTGADPLSRGVSIVDNSKVTFEHSGVYNIQFSAQFVHTTNGSETVDIWLSKNGTNVDGTNGQLTITKSPGADGKALPAWNYVLSLNANDYIELYWKANTDVLISAIGEASNPTRPSTASVIITATQVTYTQGPGGGGSALGGTVTASLIPDTDLAYDLGASGNSFRDLYLSGSTIYLKSGTGPAATISKISTDTAGNFYFQGATGATITIGPSGTSGTQGFQGPAGGGSGSGLQGFQGFQGWQGTQGLQGTQGFQGFQGNQGFQGAQGYQGAQGFQGAQGSTGGGAQGFQGFQGWQGPTGPQGVQGIQGVQGVQGVQGAQGVEGPQGFQGFQGPQGWQGTQGFQGTQGLQGTQGFQGFQGNQGFQGAQGYQGAQGFQGAQGWQGLQGDKGGLIYRYGGIGASPSSGDFVYNTSEGDLYDLKFDPVNYYGANLQTYFNSILGRSGQAIIVSNTNGDASTDIYQFTNVTLDAGNNYLFVGGIAGGSSITTNEICAVTILIDGLTGAAGSQGFQGAQGWQGPMGLGTDVKTFGVVIDGGGSAITTGNKGDVVIPYDMTITSWTIIADQSGNIVIDVLRGDYSTFPPVTSIAGSEKPTLSGVSKNQDTTLSTWTTNIAAGDIVRFNVDSASTVTRVTLSIQGTIY